MANNLIPDILVAREQVLRVQQFSYGIVSRIVWLVFILFVVIVDPALPATRGGAPLVYLVISIALFTVSLWSKYQTANSLRALERAIVRIDPTNSDQYIGARYERLTLASPPIVRVAFEDLVLLAASVFVIITKYILFV
jgi:hypothetical protein